RFLDLGERLQAALDLAQGDPLAVDLDQVVFATLQEQPAAAVEAAQVTGAVPARRVALARGRSAAGLGLLERMRTHPARRPRRAGHQDAALVRARRQGGALRIGEPNLHAVDDLADRLGRLAAPIDRDHPGLGRMIDADEPLAVASPERLRHLLLEPRSTRQKA